MTTKYTTLAYPKAERPALDILTKLYQGEKKLLSPPSAIDTAIWAIRECLSRRGVNFLPKPDDGEAVPVLKGGRHA